MKPKRYVVRLGCFKNDGAYVRARDPDWEDWTITFDQRRAVRMERDLAELVAGDFGDARAVRLRKRTTHPLPQRSEKGE